MPRKVFVAGEILTAADVNTNLMDQAVMVFDTSAARGSAIPSPSEGMVTYLKDTDALEKFDGSNFVNVNTDSGKILQVVQTVKTDTFTTNSATFTPISGLSVSITPSSATSKILVSAYLSIGNDNPFDGVHTRFLRDSTEIFVGDAADSRVQATHGLRNTNTSEAFAGSPLFLDSPATTSAITYSMEVRRGSAGNAVVGRGGFDANTNENARVPSSITVMEVAG